MDILQSADPIDQVKLKVTDRMEDEMSREEEQGGKFTWFVVGALVGAACAMLYAPKSGKETREFISKKAQEGRDAVTDTSRDLLDRGKDVLDKGKQYVDDAASLFGRASKLVRG